MFDKKAEIPIVIKKLQVLSRRLSRNHPQYTISMEHLAKRTAGYNGELSMEYPLSLLPEKTYRILQDIRLKNAINKFSQFDTLVLSPKFILNLDVKTISGEIYFDQDFHQLVRTKDAVSEAFPDPIIQISYQETFLKRWLKEKANIPDIPIYSFVVISSPYTLIRASTKEQRVVNKIFHSNYLPTKISQLEKIHTYPILPAKELKRVSRKLIKSHTPNDSCVMEKYQLTEKDIRKGVHCPNCEFLPMKRVYSSWFCPACETKSQTAHKLALSDYSLLFGKSITNREARAFLQLANHSITNRLLTSMNLAFTGEGRGRVYYMD